MYFVCLLGAIRFGVKARWGVFWFFWALALCTRQTAVAWGAIPLVAGIAAAKRSADKWTVAEPWLVIAAGGAWFFLVRALMNKTLSQTAITDHLFEGWSAVAAYRAALTGLVVCLAGFGLGSLATGGCERLSRSPRRLLLAGIFVVVAVGLFMHFEIGDYVAFDDDAFALQPFRVYLAAIVAVAALGLATLGPDLSRVLVAAAGGAVTIVTLRHLTWDYYLADAFFFSFFAIGPAPMRPRRRIAENFALAAALFSLGFVVHFKTKYDQAYAIGTLGRRALETGVVSPAEASFLPFGLMGWYYFPYHAQHDGKTTGDIAAFGDRMKQDTFDLAVRYPWPLRRLSRFKSALPQDRSSAVAEGRFSFCWFTYADYRLSRTASARVRAGRGPFPRDFKLPVFPSDDQGWWALAHSMP